MPLPHCCSPVLRRLLATALTVSSPLAFALPGCNDSLFVDAIAESAWTNLDVTPAQGTGGIRAALVTAREQYPNVPVRIRLAAGSYPDTLGHELYAQRLLRTASNPVLIQATNPAPNATVLGHGINLLGVSYVAIDGVTIGPASVGAWNGTVHAAPLPLSAAAGIHIAGAANNATANAGAGGTLNTAIYGNYAPSHHIIIRRVTIQNLFDAHELDAETSDSQGMDGMKFNQVEDLWVWDSGVTQTTRHGIDNVGVHRAAFCRNVISRTGGGQGIEAKGGSVDVLFDSNTFYRVRRVELGGEETDATYYYSADGRWDYEALRVIARNNLIIDAREAALEFSGCLDCSAVDNSILFTAHYVVPRDGGTVYGGDAIRIHDSRILGASEGAGSDCQWWDGNDYVTVDPCWGVGANAPAPVNRVLRSDNVTVSNNLFASVNGTFSSALGGSTIPCPLNINGGSATLHFDGNFWWNGPHALPTDGCSLLPEGSHSVVPVTAPFMAPPLAATSIDGSTLASTASSAIAALTPPVGSALVGRAIASAASGSFDRIGTLRGNSATVGALVRVPSSAPGTPTNLSATPGAGKATFTFTAPVSNGGSTITSYSVTCTASGRSTRIGTASASPVTVTGLVGGVSYACRVTATNGVGSGTSSSALTLIPLRARSMVPALLLLLLS